MMTLFEPLTPKIHGPDVLGPVSPAGERRSARRNRNFKTTK